MNARKLMTAVSVAAALTAQATPDLPSEELTSYLQVSNVVMRQIAANQDVYVDYELSGGPAIVFLDICTNGVSIGRQNITSLSGDCSSTEQDLVSDGARRMVWKARTDWRGHFETVSQAHVRAYRTNNVDQIPGVYMVVDLSGGPNAASYPISYSLTPPDPLTDDTCCSNKLWLRRVETNTFVMGSPESEGGRSSNETQHVVTLTNAFFIGVFPVTRAQYTLVMGSVPSGQNSSSVLCPVDLITYQAIRGAKTNTADNIDWPNTGYNVLSNSFFGVLRSKTGGSLRFDLPTEAEWECACRAGTETAWNNGTDYSVDSSGVDENLGKLGWYVKNSNDHLHMVGRQTPNAWGLYDCHGNLCEWCLDWMDKNGLGTNAVIEPVGASSGSSRVLRGGTFYFPAGSCRSAFCMGRPQFTIEYGRGFRVALVVGP